MNIKKSTLKIIGFAFIGLFILGLVLLSGVSTDTTNTTPTSNVQGAVTMEGNNQILELRVRGGYFPSTINAKATTPGILRMTTANSFDCSTAVVISKLKYRNNLPYTGVTDLEIPPQPAGTTIDGNCSMGMYSFKIVFN
jgi:plastocyanin domain-containing protein